MAASHEIQHRRKISITALTAVALVVVAGIFVPMFAEPLDALSIFGFPLGYLVTAQGSLIALVGTGFWLVRRQASIDDDHALSED